MPEVPLLLKGWLLGFAIAAPVGPIGILCIRRTLAEGRLIGFLSGLGAATADMLFAVVAAFGVTAVQTALLTRHVWLQIAGGLFLVYLGLRTFFAAPADHAAGLRPARGRLSAYLSTFGLTLTNPATILSFSVIFGAFQLGPTSGPFINAGLLVLGVFLGSATWWLLLSGSIGFFAGRFNPDWMAWVNRAAGTIIAAFGVATLLA